MMILAILNSKGGVGKTTIAVHVALYFSDTGWLGKYRPRIAVLDCDPQCSTCAWLRTDPGRHRINVVPVHGARRIVSEVERCRAVYDMVLADGPAKLDVHSMALAGVADAALIPAGPSALDMSATREMVQHLQAIQSQRRERRPATWVVLNRVQPWTRLGQEAIEAANGLGVPVCQQMLVARNAYADAASQGAPVWDLGARARKAATEMKAFCREVARKLNRIKEPA